MNPSTEIQQPHAPPQALQPPRSSFSCDRHPVENFTGFCPSCLCERLTTLDQSAAAGGATSSSRRNSTSSSSAAAALKSLFRAPASSVSKSSFLPELRRSKSFSATKNDGLGFPAGGFEPQRKSCDVRGRNTLWSLFSIHDENNNNIINNNNNINKQNGVVLETNREESEEDDDEIHEDDVVLEEEEVNVNGVNGIVEEPVENEVTALSDLTEKVTEVTESILKPMKDHIDLDTQSKKSTRSNFWSAASVLSKKWQKWRRKQKKDGDDVTRNGVVLSSSSCNALPAKKKGLLKSSNNKYRETQSEIADYGFGRRSCEYDAGRFSLDAGRVSFDDPRYSFDEPRASWDGYLIGRTFPRLPPMVEDDVPVVHVARCDSTIPVEDGNGNGNGNGPVGSGMGTGRVGLDENGMDIPGGSVQTREYYLDSSSKRRKSLDRSNSIRRMAASVVAELDSNSRATMPVAAPSVNVETEAPRVSNCNSLRDDCGSETFELGFRDRDIGVVPIGVEKKEMKKPRKWRWKLWGLIHRRNSKDDDEEDRCSSVSGVGRSYAESWQDLRTHGENRGIDVNRNVFRSNSSVSWRSSSLRRTNPNVNGSLAFGNGNGNGNGNGKSRRGGDEFVLDRNRSARYSPNHIDNGLLRFYLAPLSGSRRGGIGISTGKSKPTSNSHSIARSMLRLY